MLNLVKIFGAGVTIFTTVFSSASAADMIDNENPPSQVRAFHHSHRHAEKARPMAYDQRDCGQLYYEYRTTPRYTEIKTMCGQRPVVYDTGVIYGTAPR